METATIPDSYTGYKIAIHGSESLFDFEQPDLKKVSIWTIAKSLSNICRFNGHCDFYSVAEHSVLVQRLAALSGENLEVQMHCLMHDAQECLIGDITNPMKRFFPAIKEYEVVELIPLFEKKFKLKSENNDKVKQYDFEAFKIESHSFFPGAFWLPEKPRHEIKLGLLLPNEAMKLFQDAYLKLYFYLNEKG